MHSAMRSLQAIAIALVSTFPQSWAPALAQSWPQRPVRVIVPNPPGTAIDLITRLFSERLGSRWGWPAIVENLPGADGNVAVREFVSRRDDHTLLYSFAGPITINPLIYQRLPYDPARDLVPISSTTDNFLVVAVSAALKVSSLAELERIARSRSNRLNWAATPGLPYFAFAGFEKSAGLDMVHVPYRDFNQAFVDLSEGRIDVVSAGVAPLLSYVSAGKVRLLACFNDQRAPASPEVITMAEAGYGNLTFSAITGFFAGRDMPNELRKRIAADIQAIGGDPAIGRRLQEMGSAVRTSTPTEFALIIEEQRAKVAAVAAAIGTKPTQ